MLPRGENERDVLAATPAVSAAEPAESMRQGTAGNTARPTFCTMVMRPKAVPVRSFLTISGTDGHIAAGTRTNAAPRAIMGSVG